MMSNLFQAQGPLEQIELILNLTGTPTMEDLEHCHPEACCFALSFRPRRPNPASLYSLSSEQNDAAVDLLSNMLRFNPVRSQNEFFDNISSRSLSY